jgi:hypothetical protein
MATEAFSFPVFGVGCELVHVTWMVVLEMYSLLARDDALHPKFLRVNLTFKHIHLSQKMSYVSRLSTKL